MVAAQVRRRSVSRSHELHTLRVLTLLATGVVLVGSTRVEQQHLGLRAAGAAAEHSIHAVPRKWGVLNAALSLLHDAHSEVQSVDDIFTQPPYAQGTQPMKPAEWAIHISLSPVYSGAQVLTLFASGPGLSKLHLATVLQDASPILTEMLATEYVDASEESLPQPRAGLHGALAVAHRVRVSSCDSDGEPYVLNFDTQQGTMTLSADVSNHVGRSGTKVELHLLPQHVGAVVGDELARFVGSRCGGVASPVHVNGMRLLCSGSMRMAAPPAVRRLSLAEMNMEAAEDVDGLVAEGPSAFSASSTATEPSFEELQSWSSDNGTPCQTSTSQESSSWTTGRLKSDCFAPGTKQPSFARTVADTTATITPGAFSNVGYIAPKNAVQASSGSLLALTPVIGGQYIGQFQVFVTPTGTDAQHPSHIVDKYRLGPLQVMFQAISRTRPASYVWWSSSFPFPQAALVCATYGVPNPKGCQLSVRLRTYRQKNYKCPDGYNLVDGPTPLATEQATTKRTKHAQPPAGYSCSFPDNFGRDSGLRVVNITDAVDEGHGLTSIRWACHQSFACAADVDRQPWGTQPAHIAVLAASIMIGAISLYASWHFYKTRAARRNGCGGSDAMANDQATETTTDGYAQLPCSGEQTEQP